jgi:hypothetical protein
MITEYLILYLQDVSYINMMIYMTFAYVCYYLFSISFVSIALLIIGIIIGVYISYKFKTFI